MTDIVFNAQSGAKALNDGDMGRSQFLIGEVVTFMEQLSVDECKWLSIAVGYGAQQRIFHETVNTQAEPVVTANGEIWDI